MPNDFMPRSVSPKSSDETAPKPSRSGQILLNLRSAAEKMSARYPEALKLEAEIVAIIAEETKGESEIFRGPRGKEVWGDVTEGKRRAHVGDITRVFASQRPKGRRAAERIVDLLAAYVGRVTSPAATVSADFDKALEQHAEGSGRLLSMGIRARADGHLDEAEREALRKEIHARQDELVRLQVSLHVAEKSGR
jgi:hypothetical protein